MRHAWPSTGAEGKPLRAQWARKAAWSDGSPFRERWAMERTCFPVSYKAGFVSTGTTGGAPPGIPQRHPLAKQTPTPFPTPKNMTLEKPADRDSISVKVFGKGGMGFGEGREKLFFRKVFPPFPNNIPATSPNTLSARRDP